MKIAREVVIPYTISMGVAIGGSDFKCYEKFVLTEDQGS
jgi:hypothetical protein